MLPIESPELRLLLSCVPDTRHARQQAAVYRSIAHLADWDRLIGLAERHRMVPQTCRILQHYSGLVPARVLAKLRLGHDRCIFQGMLMQAELARIAAAFRAAGIAVIGLKGPVVEQQVYAAGQRRQYRDLDLLVEPDSLPAGCELLAQLGYSGQVADVCRISSAQRSRLTRYYKHVHGHRMAGSLPLVVELHWRLAGTPRMFAECAADIWQRPATVRIANTEVSALPERELLIFLACHGGRHRWKRLSWLCDFTRAVERTSADDWESIFERANQLRLGSYLELGLLMLERCVPCCSLPVTAATLMQNAGRLQRAFASSCHAMVADEMYYENQPFSGVRWYFDLEHCAADRMHALKSLLVPADDDLINHGWWRAGFLRLQHLYERLRGIDRRQTPKQPAISHDDVHLTATAEQAPSTPVLPQKRAA